MNYLTRVDEVLDILNIDRNCMDYYRKQELGRYLDRITDDEYNAGYEDGYEEGKSDAEFEE